MIDVVDEPGVEKFSPARAIGAAMADYMSKHRDFYLFSPDETTSNKLDAVYEVSSRAWSLAQEKWDLPEAVDGQIVEMLSENTLFACMVGHLMQGEPAAMTSYEAFFPIITSQILQHIKFLNQCAEADWRPDYPAANLLSTSTCWRQDHNGYTHQSPALISTLLGVPSARVNCLFPVDDVAAEAAFIYSLDSKNVVNLITFNKTEQPRWLDSHAADAQFSAGGASEFEFLSDDGEPDYVLVGAGDIVTSEASAALRLLRADLPDKKFRFVNISALSYNAIGPVHRRLEQDEFSRLFTVDRPLIVNFHGYPGALTQILRRYTNRRHVHIHGFRERGSTTTPFQMLSVNHASRYHLALDVARLEKRPDLVKKYQEKLQSYADYAHEHGVDPPELED